MLSVIALGLASECSVLEVEHCFGAGPISGYQIKINSECQLRMSGSQTVSDKIHCRKGNSPDRQLRSLSVC